jgi:hypothetical protein
MTGEQLRRLFNRNYTPDRYEHLLQLLEARCHEPVPFRVCETPCFFDFDFMRRCARDGESLIHQLTGSPGYWEAAGEMIPARYKVPNEPAEPLFVQVDFGVVRGEEGLLQPRLVEIQAFPSLYCFQPALARAYMDAYELPTDLHYLLDGLSMDAYTTILREAIAGGHDPENVVLLEASPETQKTRPDFVLTQELLGVRTVCLSKVKREGSRLLYEKDGRHIPIRRIYNRVIFDDLARLGMVAPFDWTADLDVEWAGHPNHYFRISKFSIPFLDHPCVPKAHFLNRLEAIPDRLEDWVLKPLFSFAGRGVVIGPSREEVDAVPQSERHLWLLQQRVPFTPAIETPHGPTQAEIRVMFVAGRPVTHIIRMGRGRMMGVDHNRNLEWVGASAALYHEES